MKLNKLSRLTILLFPFLLSSPVFGSASVSDMHDTGNCLIQSPESENTKARGSAQMPAGSLPAIAEALGPHLPPAYQIKPAPSIESGDDNQFNSTNPRQQLDYEFLDSGVKIRPSSSKAESWTLSVTLAGYGYSDSIEKVEPLGLRAANRTRLNYQHSGNIEQWFINSPFGLEHGFTLHAPPVNCGSDSEVVLELALDEGLIPKIEADDRTVIFFTSKGNPALTYSGLRAWDAAGRDLPARMVADKHRLALHVDIKGAEFPVMVDPLFATESKINSSQPKTDGDFGRSIALDGPWLVIGALLEDSGPEPVLPGDPIPPQGGAAYVYQRQGDGSYAEYQRLTADDAVSQDHFGIGVAISGETIAIGASEHDLPGLNNAGAVYIYEFDSTACTADCWQQSTKLTANVPVAEGSFGNAVDIDNDTMIAGAKGEEAAYILERSAGLWSQTAQLGPSAGQTLTEFGNAVAISGDYSAVGAPQGENFFSGATYIYNRGISPGWGLEDKIPGVVFERFGFSLDLNGGTLVAGAPGTAGNTGAARVYTRDTGGQWDTNPPVNLQPLQADNVTPDAAAGDFFGNWVNISVGQAGMDYILVSSLNNDDGGTDSGSAYIYQDQGIPGWQQVKKLVASDAAANDHFGSSVEIYGEVAVVGAQDKIVSSVDAGAVYAYYDPTDSDSDGLSDQVENQICYETGGVVCTDTGLSDTDEDGVSDGDEINYGGGSGFYFSGDLDPANPDSDGDAVSDGDEILAGTNPLDPADTPLFGDINDDGNIDVADVLRATRMALGLESWTDGQLVRGNVAPLVDGLPAPVDSVIGADDVLVIQRWALQN